MKEYTYIYGRHAVLEALRQRPDLVAVVYIDPQHQVDPQIMKALQGIAEVRLLEGKKLPRGVSRDAVHQGFIAAFDTDALLIDWKQYKRQMVVQKDTAVVVLGEVQDPHNVGAIIRSAAAFGVSAVLIPEHRQAPITGTVIKVSAGMAFRLPLISIKNVNAALRDLKELGFWIYGLDMEGDTSVHDETFPKPTVLVVGNEGEGIRQKTAELCDSILTIPMHPHAESLNASVSTAVAMYAWSARHTDALSA